jgi:hypothetical protein
MTIQAEMGGAGKDLGKCKPAFSSRAKTNAIDTNRAVNTHATIRPNVNAATIMKGRQPSRAGPEIPPVESVRSVTNNQAPDRKIQLADLILSLRRKNTENRVPSNTERNNRLPPSFLTAKKGISMAKNGMV